MTVLRNQFLLGRNSQVSVPSSGVKAREIVDTQLNKRNHVVKQRR